MFAENDQSTADNLSDVLGELKIDETGIGMISSYDIFLYPRPVAYCQY
jgi:hypothetical protein